MTAPPEEAKAVDPHDYGPEPIFDVIPDLMGESTARIVAREGSQIAASIDEKLCVDDVVPL